MFKDSLGNYWTIQKIDLPTSTWGSLCNIAKYLTHLVLTFERVKLMVKVWFSLLIYETFNTFKEAMKYTLFEVTIAKLRFYTNFCFLKFDQGPSKSSKKCKNQLKSVIIF